jgi:hypothetical protein
MTEIIDFDEKYRDVDITSLDPKDIKDLEECRFLLRECNAEIVRLNAVSGPRNKMRVRDYEDLCAYKLAKSSFEQRAATLNFQRKELLKQTVSGPGANFRQKYFALVSCINTTLDPASARAVFDAFDAQKIAGEG